MSKLSKKEVVTKDEDNDPVEPKPSQTVEAGVADEETGQKAEVFNKKEAQTATEKADMDLAQEDLESAKGAATSEKDERTNGGASKRAPSMSTRKTEETRDPEREIIGRQMPEAVMGKHFAEAAMLQAQGDKQPEGVFVPHEEISVVIPFFEGNLEDIGGITFAGELPSGYITRCQREYQPTSDEFTDVMTRPSKLGFCTDNKPFTHDHPYLTPEQIAQARDNQKIGFIRSLELMATIPVIKTYGNELVPGRVTEVPVSVAKLKSEKYDDPNNPAAMIDGKVMLAQPAVVDYFSRDAGGYVRRYVSELEEDSAGLHEEICYTELYPVLPQVPEDDNRATTRLAFWSARTNRQVCQDFNIRRAWIALGLACQPIYEKIPTPAPPILLMGASASKFARAPTSRFTGPPVALPNGVHIQKTSLETVFVDLVLLPITGAWPSLTSFLACFEQLTGTKGLMAGGYHAAAAARVDSIEAFSKLTVEDLILRPALGNAIRQFLLASAPTFIDLNYNGMDVALHMLTDAWRETVAFHRLHTDNFITWIWGWPMEYRGNVDVLNAFYLLKYDVNSGRSAEQLRVRVDALRGHLRLVTDLADLLIPTMGIMVKKGGPVRAMWCDAIRAIAHATGSSRGTTALSISINPIETNYLLQQLAAVTSPRRMAPANSYSSPQTFELFLASKIVDPVRALTMCNTLMAMSQCARMNLTREECRIANLSIHSSAGTRVLTGDELFRLTLLSTHLGVPVCYARHDPLYLKYYPWPNPAFEARMRTAVLEVIEVGQVIDYTPPVIIGNELYQRGVQQNTYIVKQDQGAPFNVLDENSLLKLDLPQGPQKISLSTLAFFGVPTLRVFSWVEPKVEVTTSVQQLSLISSEVIEIDFPGARHTYAPRGFLVTLGDEMSDKMSAKVLLDPRWRVEGVDGAFRYIPTVTVNFAGHWHFELEGSPLFPFTAMIVRPGDLEYGRNFESVMPGVTTYKIEKLPNLGGLIGLEAKAD